MLFVVFDHSAVPAPIRAGASVKSGVNRGKTPELI